MKEISSLSHVTGTEHDQISRFLLALVADICLPDGHSNAQLIHPVCAVLDFIYLARYPIHTSETLGQMNDALHMFHLNHDIFISLGICKHFNIPKLHDSSHYYEFIQLYGSPDNFNTEYTERLHIDLTKNAYTSTNFKDEFPQMTCWLDQKEHVMQHEKYLCWHLETSFNNHSMFKNHFPLWFLSTDCGWQSTNSLRCTYWGYLHQVWCYSIYSCSITVHCSVSTSWILKSPSKICFQPHSHSFFQSFSLSLHQICQSWCLQPKSPWWECCWLNTCWSSACRQV